MSKLTSLAWKEWHDARPFLWVGLGVFLGLPLAGAVESKLASHYGRLDLSATPWVIGLGGVLAVFAGVGVTTPDRRPKLEDFWRSRPIQVGRWLAVKYAVGLAVVLVACAVPTAFELLLDRHTDPAVVTTLTFLPFFWTAIFSLAFLAGCLVARPSHAAALGLAAMLLIYLLPVVLPPLSWMNVADFDGVRMKFGEPPFAEWRHLWGSRQVAFAAGMLAVAAAAAMAAVVGVGRGWRVESGRRTLYGLVATALLLLFGSAAYQLGTNLPVLQRAELPADEDVTFIGLSGPAAGTVYARRPVSHPGRSWVIEYQTLSHTFALRPDGMEVGPPTPMVPNADDTVRFNAGVSQGNVVYVVHVPDRTPPPTASDAELTTTLQTIDRRTGATIGTLKLWTSKSTDCGAGLYLWDNRLYAYGHRTEVIDVSRPDQPSVVSDGPPLDYSMLGRPLAKGDQLTIGLLALPGLPPAQRLELSLPRGINCAFDGRILCES